MNYPHRAMNHGLTFQEFKNKNEKTNTGIQKSFLKSFSEELQVMIFYDELPTWSHESWADIADFPRKLGGYWLQSMTCMLAPS